MADQQVVPKIKVITSQQGKLDWRDYGKGALVAVITAILTFIQNSLEAGQFTLNFKTIAITASTALIAYLLKNVFTPSKTIVEFKSPADQASN